MDPKWVRLSVAKKVFGELLGAGCVLAATAACAPTQARAVPSCFG